LISGVELEDGKMSADKATLVDSNAFESLIEIVIHSGKNRVVRRMFEAIGHPVKDLVRRQFGPVHLGPLKPGQTRLLSKVEVGALLKSAQGTTTRAPRPKSKGGPTTKAKPKGRRSGV
jgi:16S rRNA U516 pseudouridylate synthase RsuA-like enzyme